MTEKVEVSVSRGLFGITDDFGDKFLSLDERYLSHHESVFFVRASGDSMLPEIKAKDILIVDRSLELFHGCTATFFYNHKPICKQYLKTKEGIILRSFNEKHKDIIINNNYDPSSFQLFGVVKAIVRDLT